MRRAVLVLVLSLALVTAVAGCGGSGDESQPAAPADSAAATPAQSSGADLSPATDGDSLFAQHCAGCHGNDGRGSVVIAGEDDAAEIARVVTDGAEGMPGYGDQLTADQIKAVSEYVATQLK
jgi:mono/diheme cytochrome c family protein